MKPAASPLAFADRMHRAARRVVLFLVSSLLGSFALGVSVHVFAASLTVEDGVVVKFGRSADIVVNHRLETGRHVVMTSLADDSTGGETSATPGTPVAGDWHGVTVGSSVTPSSLAIDGLEIRYAGAGGGAALDVAAGYATQFLQITDSVLGVRVHGAATPTFDGLSLLRNDTGLESSDASSPTLTTSEIGGSRVEGVSNATPATLVHASGNWWGAPTGPHDPVNNPSGDGDAVTSGVEYTPYSQDVPLIDCSIVVADGQYTVSAPTVVLALECRNAVDYRLSDSASFGSAPYLPFASLVTYNISGGPGDKNVRVQYRAQYAGQPSNNVVVSLPEPIHYNPDLPVVSITNPDDGATLTTDAVVVSASASDGTGIDHVDFYFDETLVGTDTTAPYEAFVSLAGVSGDPSQPHTIRAHATSVTTQTADDTRTVYVQHSGGSGPGAPIVEITAPAAGATVTADTLITATVTGDDIDHVDFYADDTHLATVAAGGPYETVWHIAGFAPNESHELRAVATNGSGLTGEDMVAVSLESSSSDTEGPVISNVRFAGMPFVDPMTATSPGLLTFDASDPSGVASASLKVNDQDAGGGLNNGHYSTLLTFDGLSGPVSLELKAIDTAGNPTILDLSIAVDIPAPQAPTILVPAGNATVATPTIAVSGQAEPSSRVDLYLGSASVASTTAAFNGTFNATVSLPDHGTYSLTATATTSRGTSPHSAPPISITYAPPPPSVVMTSPGANAVIEDDVDITASIVDPTGTTTAILTIGDVQYGDPIGVPPYTWHWQIGDAATTPDGPYQLKVIATNAGGSTTVIRDVTVQRASPPPPQTAYTGVVDSVSPASSYGEQTITIAGRAIDRQQPVPQPVANALLKLVLQVNGFQRRINVVTGADGAFVYLFHPQASDGGRYDVSALHPDETSLTNEQSFTITRLTVTPTQIHLNAARTVPATVHLTARVSSGTIAHSVHVGYESLPNGISVQLPPSVDIGCQQGQTPPACESAPLDIVVTGSSGAGEAGTLVFTVYSDTSGNDEDHARAVVAVNYLLSDPQVALFPQPSSIETGVKIGSAISASTQLSNRGFLGARHVHVTLTDADGDPPPPWVSLTSPKDVDPLEVGASMPIEITASPPDNNTVVNGTYPLKIHVSYDGSSGDMWLWATITVSNSTQGSAEFHAMDIYTNTCIPDDSGTCPQGGPIVPGLANASITLRREECTVDTNPITCNWTVAGTAVTGADGRATFPTLDTGHYRYVATAPSHASATGFFTVRPDVTWFEEPFLDYELVSFEWSVTETTIQDRYDVTLTATFQTQVPAPVVLIEPMSINLPDMQGGEEFTGEITITNYGLVRADHVVFTPPPLQPPNDDGFFSIEFLGDVPESLEAHQRVTLAYKVTAVGSLPGVNGASVFELATGAAKSGGTCHAYSAPMNLGYDFTCAAGSTRTGSATAGFNKAWGGSCSTSSPSSYGWEGGGGLTCWPGGHGGPLGGEPMSDVPACTPDCKTCCHMGNQPGGS